MAYIAATISRIPVALVRSNRPPPISGITLAPTSPTTTAAPVPNARTRVGYCSGV